MSFREDIQKFVDEYLLWTNKSEGTRYGYRYDLSQFADFLEGEVNGPVYTEEITQGDIEKFLLYLKTARHCAPMTLFRYLSSIKSFFEYARRRGLISQNPAAELAIPKQPKKLPVYLEEDEVEKLARALNPTLETIVWCLYFTGLRISELTSLKLQDVDFKNKYLIVRNGKGRKDRLIPLNSKLETYLQRYLKNYRRDMGTDYFFSTAWSGRISSGHVSQSIREAARRIGLGKRVSAHTLRHSFATSLYRKGVGLKEIATLLGHASLRSTEIYTHLGNRGLYAVVNLL